MDSLTDLFCKLVSIPSPSGHELAVGTFIKETLTDDNIKANFDNSGKLNDSISGNLIARIPGNLPVTILFVAHMDTVEKGNKVIKTQVEKGVIKSDGTTILGADNKGSVTALIGALKELVKLDNKPSIIAAFTTREEQGKMGSSVLDLPDKIDFAFNIDGREPIGKFVYQTLGEVPFKLIIKGKASHAAAAPEKGINAITTTAEILTRLNIGKTEEGHILNIGKIRGGTANNIVPDLVEMEGQARAFTAEEINSIFGDIESAVELVCSRTGCTFELIRIPEEGAPPASLPVDHPIVQISKKATESIGLTFSLEKGSFSSDANYLSQKYPTITVIRGSKNPHSFEESMSIEVLENLKKLIISLAMTAADTGK
jgi:tripeptide aminopeptidase